MGKIKYIYILLFFWCGLFSSFAQNISVDETFNTEDLVNNILINSSCATALNINFSGGNFANGEKSFGFFDATGTSFPFQNGIILSTEDEAILIDENLQVGLEIVAERKNLQFVTN